MKLQQPELPDEGFEMTPMIDVVFLLIIFFMVVAAQIIKKVPVDPPVAEVAKVPEETGSRDTVSVQLDGEVWLGMSKITLDELGEEIRFSNETIPGYKVYIRADADTPHEYVRDVMQVCAENGVFDVIFATYQPEGPASQ